MKQRLVPCSWCAMFCPGSLSRWPPAASKERLPVGVWYRHETELEICILHTATLNCRVLLGLTSLAFVSLSKNNPSSKLQIKKPTKNRDNMVAGIPATPQSHPSAWPVWVRLICLNIEATDSCSLKSYTHTHIHTDPLSKPWMLMTHSVTCYQRTFHRGHVQKEKHWCDL